MRNRLPILAGIFPFVIVATFAQTRTVGLLAQDSTRSFRGYTLFSAIPTTSSYLIDNNGMKIREWSSAYRPGLALMLLPNGNLLRTAVVTSTFFNSGGAGGRVELFSWEGALLWSYEHSSSTYRTHHDIEYMPNGNVLLISWELKSRDSAIAAGRNPNFIPSGEVWSEKIIEVQPTGSSGGTIVWEWHVWDHLIQDYDATKANYGNVAQTPERIDVNFGTRTADWLHINAVRFNPIRNEIMVSIHNQHEIWVIDHSTTTTEARGKTGGRRGKGGDLLYRWGNPQAYRLGTVADQKLFGQHDARWLDNGNVLIFNNGVNRPGGNSSSIDEIVPPIAADSSYSRASGSAFGPSGLFWTYAPTGTSAFYSANISGATRLSNGNTLICAGPSGMFFEIASNGDVVWRYVNPVTGSGILTQGQTPTNNSVFRIYRYPPSYAAFTGRDLTPQGPIERYPNSVEAHSELESDFSLSQNYPNPFNPTTTLSFVIGHSSLVKLNVFNILGQEVATLVNENLKAGKYETTFNAEGMSSGVYMYELSTGSLRQTRKMILTK